MIRDYKDCICKLHIDFHTPEGADSLCKEFDCQDIVSKVKNAGFSAIQIFTKGHFGYSYYPTLVGKMHPHLDFDLFGNLANAFVKEKIKVIAYYSLRPDNYQAQCNPAWKISEIKANNGFNHVEDGNAMCFQSPYIEKNVLPQIKEIFETYPVSGMFFDFGRSNGYCGCSNCQQAFFRAHGMELPDNDDYQSPAWETYKQWKRLEQERVEIKLYEAMHSINSDAMLEINYSYTLRNPKKVPDYYGMVTMDVLENDYYGLNVSLNAKYLAGLNRPWDIMTTRMVNWWGDWNLKPINSLLYQNAVILAHGGRTFLGDRADVNWKLDDTIYDYFKQVNDFIKVRADICFDAEPVPYVGVFHDMDNYNATPSAANDHLDKLFAIKGAHKALVMKHVHHLILNNDSLKEYLPKLQMLILPDLEVINDESAEQICEYVLNGGVVIGSNGCIDNSKLQTLFGVKSKSEFPRGYLLPEKNKLDQTCTDFPISIPGKFRIVELAGATEIMKCCKPAYDSGEMLKFGSADKKQSFPGLTINNTGKGKAIYCVADIFTTYWQKNIPALKHLIGNIVKEYAPVQIIEIEAPECVEIVLMKKNNNQIVHLLNYQQERTEKGIMALMDDFIPIHNIKVKLYSKEKISKVIQVPENIALEWEQTDNYVCFNVPELQIHQAVKIF